jgi:hypothetical protein
LIYKVNGLGNHPHLACRRVLKLACRCTSETAVLYAFIDRTAAAAGPFCGPLPGSGSRTSAQVCLARRRPISGASEICPKWS